MCLNGGEAAVIEKSQIIVDCESSHILETQTNLQSLCEAILYAVFVTKLRWLKQQLFTGGICF